MKDERLSPMTYKKLKELGVSNKQWAGWTQEQADEYIRNKSGKKTSEKKEEKKEKWELSDKQASQLNSSLRKLDKYSLYEIAYGPYQGYGPIGARKDELLEDALYELLDLEDVDKINKALESVGAKLISK